MKRLHCFTECTWVPRGRGGGIARQGAGQNMRKQGGSLRGVVNSSWGDSGGGLELKVGVLPMALGGAIGLAVQELCRQCRRVWWWV